MNKTIEQAICKVTGVTDAEKWAQYNQTAFQIAEDIVKQMMKGAVEALILPTNLEETEFCISDWDDVSVATNLVKNGKAKMGDKVKVIIIKE